MAKILALAVPELVNGFRLAGIETLVTHSADQTYRELLEVVKKLTHELIIIPQEHLTNLDERKRREMDQLTEQVIISVPMSNLDRQPSPKNFVSELVHRAIGIQIKV